MFHNWPRNDDPRMQRYALQSWHWLTDRDCNPEFRDSGIPAEFSNPVILGLVASNPGIYGIEKLSIKCL